MSLEIFKPNIIISIIIVITSIIILSLGNKLITRIKSSDNVKNSTSAIRIILTSGRILKVLFIVLITLLLFEVNGINVTSLIASLGVVGAVVALAAQDLTKDMLNGLYISGEKMFNPGDIINYKGSDAIVLDFNLRSTKAKVLKSDNILFISNRNISDIEVVSSVNYMDLPFPYEVVQSFAEDIINRIITTISDEETVFSASYLGPQEFGSSAVYHRITYSCDPLDRGVIAREVRRLLLSEMESEGISIPYEKIEIVKGA